MALRAFFFRSLALFSLLPLFEAISFDYLNFEDNVYSKFTDEDDGESFDMKRDLSTDLDLATLGKIYK